MSTEPQVESNDENRIPNHVISELSNAGASTIFLDVIQTPVHQVPDADRNSARQEILKYMDWCEDTENSVSDYLNYGGGFFQALFEGQRNPPADLNNEAILEYVRSENSTGVTQL